MSISTEDIKKSEPTKTTVSNTDQVKTKQVAPTRFKSKGGSINIEGFIFTKDKWSGPITDAKIIKKARRLNNKLIEDLDFDGEE